jgi:hypothetical protein
MSNCNKCNKQIEDDFIQCSECGNYCVDCAESEEGWIITMHPHHNRDLCPRCAHLAKESPIYYGTICRKIWIDGKECLVTTPHGENKACNC